MSSYIKTLCDKKLLKLDPSIREGIIYETLMGSIVYGVSQDNSDLDIYSVAIPPKKDVFPHLDGYVHGFGKEPKVFDVFQQHHIQKDKQVFDINIFSIIKYFNLVLQGNPNMTDSLWSPGNYVTHITSVGEIMRGRRNLFLSKECYRRFKGYAYSQYKKINTKTHDNSPRRLESIQKYGYDVKYGYHLVRLLLECEEILMHQTLTLNKNIEILSSIRRGEWTKERLFNWFQSKETVLEELYIKSDLRVKPDFEDVKSLLMECLEAYYGSIDKAIVINNNDNLLEDIKKLVGKYDR